MVLIVFAILAVIGQAINVFVCLALDNIFSPTVGALTFVVMYMLVFAAAWQLAVRIAERWQPSDAPGQDRATPPRRPNKHPNKHAIAAIAVSPVWRRPTARRRR